MNYVIFCSSYLGLFSALTTVDAQSGIQSRPNSSAKHEDDIQFSRWRGRVVGRRGQCRERRLGQILCGESTGRGFLINYFSNTKTLINLKEILVDDVHRIDQGHILFLSSVILTKKRHGDDMVSLFL
jgi:hypothetical protein